MKNIFIALVLATLCCLIRTTALSQTYNKELWLEDFTQLKKEMSSHYANLEWAVTSRGMNLKDLSSQTEISLQSAKSDIEAKRIFSSFLNAFGDGHLSIQWPAPAKAAAASTDTVSQPSQTLCEKLNFESMKFSPGKVAFSNLSAFQEILNEDSKFFAIGILNLDAKNRVGVIELPIFSEYAFPELCEAAGLKMSLTETSPCDSACEDLIERHAANLLTDALTRQIEVLKKKQISALLIDITGNGGGTNWVEPAARVLTPRPLQSPRQLFVRHPHWTEQFLNRSAIVNNNSSRFNDPSKQYLLKGSMTLKRAIDSSKQLCDLSGIWENAKSSCSNIVQGISLYPQSILPYVKQGALPDEPASRYLFFPSRYTYQEGVYKGELIILVDRDTWSSAEYFAAMLQDNKAAKIIGEPTGGAGCGYTNGGIKTVLKNSLATVKIPDCVRLRADGSNEVEGITPDIIIPWRFNDSRYQRVKRVSDVLSIHLTNKK